jgi:hypothetical protein
MDLSHQPFDIFKMRAIFQSFWVRKLIGKLGVPYNRRLRVRGSPHPHDYAAGLSLAAAESNAFRIQADLASFARLMAAIIALFSSGETLACIKIPLNLAFGTVGLPIFGFINSFCMTKKMLTYYRLCHTFSQHQKRYGKHP